MIKVGLVGPKEIVERMHRIIRAKYQNVNLIDLAYDIYSESSIKVNVNQDKLDALLFAGKVPFKIAEAEVEQKIPWDYLPRSSHTLLRALLEASFIKKYDITNISIDTYTDNLVYEAYEEIGMKADQLKVYIAEQKILNQNYFDYLLDFHVRNYRKKGVACTITGITEIYQELKKIGIPCIRTTAAANVILSTFNQLQLKYLAQANKESQIVVISVQVELPSVYSVNRNNEHEYLMKIMKISEKVYLFASLIEAAVVSNSNNEFLLFTTKKSLEYETNNLESIYLLDLIQETTEENINIGIGYGKTAREAKYNAYDGVTKSKIYGGNVAFAVYDINHFRGPLKCVQKKKIQIIDKKFSNISAQTGISNNTLSKIARASMRFEKGEFTSRELAVACDMSYRNMDRIISKLQDVNCCEIVGERLMNDTGRPSRILRFKFL